MDEARLPKLFRDALEAQATRDAADAKQPLRLRRRLWVAWQTARAALHQEYPGLESWLASSMGDWPLQQAQRDELLRLIAAAQKEASDE